MAHAAWSVLVSASAHTPAVLGGSWLGDDHVLGHADRGDLCCRGRGRPRSIDVREPMSEYESVAAVATFGRVPGRAMVS